MAKKDDILSNALKRATYEGWTETMLIEAGKDVGLSKTETHIIFPDGVKQLLAMFNQSITDQMKQKLEEIDLDTISIKQRIKLAIQTRLTLLEAHKLAVNRAMQFYALPQHNLLAITSLAEISDQIWYAIGDKSTDVSFYTKRLTLGMLYSSTLLYWLQDDSTNNKETNNFLDRGLNNILKLGKAKSALYKFLSTKKRKKTKKNNKT